MSELRRQLKESIGELERLRHMKAYITDLERRLDAEENQLAVMSKTLDKEQRDVELLEREGLTAMFRKFLGDREERLEKEREEYLRASLRYNECYKAVELIRYELSLLLQKPQDEEALKLRIHILIRERGEELKAHDPEVAPLLHSIDLQLEKWYAFIAEVEEAIIAGTESLALVNKITQNLHAARQWGRQDMYNQRGRLRSKQKYKSIDRARHAAYLAKNKLLHFSRELQDVYRDRQIQISLDVGQFDHFAEFFFDNLITDWLVQQKIYRTLSHVVTIRDTVESLLAGLREELAESNNRLQELEVERNRLILER